MPSSKASSTQRPRQKGKVRRAERGRMQLISRAAVALRALSAIGPRKSRPDRQFPWLARPLVQHCRRTGAEHLQADAARVRLDLS
jgi:hypothetical protein